MPLVYIIMGVSGCGKSTVGTLLAERLGCPFYEGDSFHSASSVAKMQAGIPLTDGDRWPWLHELASVVQRHLAAGQPAVLSCSALKPAYRSLLRTGIRSDDDSSSGNGSSTACGLDGGDVAFVLLDLPRALLEQRLRQRAAAGAHFMPASLVNSQLAALQYEERELFMRVTSAGAGSSGSSNGKPFMEPQQVVDAIVQRISRCEEL